MARRPPDASGTRCRDFGIPALALKTELLFLSRSGWSVDGARAEASERAVPLLSAAEFTRRPPGGSRFGARLAAVLALGVASLSGCASAPPPETFDLSGVSAAIAAAPKPHGQLAIGAPTATAPTDSDRIVVRTTANSVATLKGAQWSDPLPRLVQTQLVRSFENARFLRSVGRQGSGIEARYTLESEIRRFEIDVGSGEAIVELSIKLVAATSGVIVDAHVFTARAPASAASSATAAAALDTALSQAMRDIVAWTARRV